MSWRYRLIDEWLEYNKNCSELEMVPPRYQAGKVLLELSLDTDKAIAHCKTQYQLDHYYNPSSSNDNYWKDVEREILNHMIDHILSDQ